MWSLRQLLAASGIGMAQVRIRLDDAEHPRGSTVSGVVELEGGIAAQHVHAIYLKLIAYRPSGKTTEEKVLAQAIAARSLDVLPRSRHLAPLRFTIADDAWLTAPKGWKNPSSGCKIAADVDIALAANPRCQTPLNVTVHREIQAVQQAMRRIGFTDRHAGLSITLKTPPPLRCVTHFTPPPALEDQLDEAVLSLEAGSLKVYGTLDLNPRETTLREKMRALVVTQFQVFPLEFDRYTLLTASGAPNWEPAVYRIQEILAESLVLPDNEKMRLLRPAVSPATDSLLRPASGGPGRRPNELLRPVDDEPI